MFNRFIVATDLSPASFAMVQHIGNLKLCGARHCLLLQCLSPEEYDSTVFAYDTKVLSNILRQQKEILKNQGYSVETRVVSGNTKHQLNQIALRENYALFVVGTREYSLIGESFLGGGANDVMHHACKPVLRLRGDLGTGEKNYATNHFRFNEHVLYPTDFSDNSTRAFRYVKELVACGAQRVTLFHVQKPQHGHSQKVRPGDAGDSPLQYLKDLQEALRGIGKAKIRIEMREGSPTPEILRWMLEHEVQLVVMASHCRNMVEEFFVGSVSHDIARHAEASVLFIPSVHPNSWSVQ
ncbi:UspA domain-containing protein [Desulfobulbus propionicus DSM 2032]|uniref:UspA domain-containing protein n=1 Tax=Desulfobulbus propionicus (strain ATCC 33891 / DSM 2032 / VKM B-1956 / 1pr3) TaxID=577650 RepID=A0A7U3YL60_DESPD|nr:universal stress protein [Desulfobulbus propionicus]ADW17421.1 UspA domain-containing protein [Desulfobulbus propionicus DSM 2032]